MNKKKTGSPFLCKWKNIFTKDIDGFMAYDSCMRL